MPTYEYQCTVCRHRVEVFQRFADAPLTVCEECGGELKKVISAPGIVFKGGGFYKTDSRPASGSTDTSSGSTPSSGD
ncbi:MAG: FmdB family transcriptional regulator [Acidobacteria bacterium]|nr:FmdB family transcriptional regulator [Acidobacteriota bacterium]